MKKLLKYQMSELKYMFIVYYTIITILLVFSTIQFSILTNESNSSMSGISFTSVVTCFILGLCIFSEYFLMAVQNGISRKTFFKGSLLCIVVSSGIFSIGDLLLVSIEQLIKGNADINLNIQIFYPGYEKGNGGVQFFFTALFFSLLLQIMMLLAGYLIAVLFYRAGKKVKVLIAAGLPIFSFIGLPLILGMFPSLADSLLTLIDQMLGLSSQNPLYALLTFTAVSAALSGLIYTSVRRIHI